MSRKILHFSTLERAKKLAQKKLNQGLNREQLGKQFLQMYDDISQDIKL